MKTATPVRLQRIRGKKTISPNGLPVRYVGRGSRYGNPFVIVRAGRRCWDVMLSHNGELQPFDICHASYHSAARSAQRAYERHILPKLDLADVDRLRGCNLSCWCKPSDMPCHGDPLLRWANR
ncbi:MAG TPA: DUF4326 domain-containing protein [Phycisphaerae bacterium]|nr:DUF4326 domain-containing protein [Phycisphaerae bacterium]